MELEIKHLAPYLPYELKLQYVERDKVISTGIMNNINHNNAETHPTRININYQGQEHIWMFKPILRPISEFGDSDDLRKVHEFIGLGKWCEAYDHYFNVWFNDLANIDKLILQAPYEIFNYFLANHYDVFGLIKNGLAIDINTIK